MKAIAMSLVCLALVGTALAQSPAKTPRDPSCAVEATTKKLVGAAKSSFMKKCQTDAAAACDPAAADKKLSGAARTSFTKKCVSDSVGS
jgi:hypothetical protein